MIKRVFITLKNNKYYSLALKRSFGKIFRKNPFIYCFVVYCIIFTVILVYKYYVNGAKFYNVDDSDSEVLKVTSLEDHNLTIAQYFELRRQWNTSNLGTYLFKNVNNSFKQKEKTFVVLVWKYWGWLKARHIDNYGPSVRHGADILKDCSVNNCVFTGNGNRLKTSDAVVVHIMHGKYPKVTERNPNQIWIFLNDEAPGNAFNMADSKIDLWSWRDVFNWSMTYKSNADVPVPYGRTVALKQPARIRVTYEAIAEMIPNLQFKRTDVLVAVLMSNCQVEYRTRFLQAMRKYIKIDVYGSCGTDDKKTLCQGHFKRDCPLLDQYYFYLVMENSMCSQYITEKAFHNAYEKGAIPILVGTFIKDSKRLLPPNSFIHASDYDSLEKLAAKINGTIQNIKEYLSYHLWRNHFEVRNEHGYFGSKSYHMCRVCEALNYNEEKQQIYSFNELRRFLDPDRLCMNLKGLVNKTKVN